MKNTANYLSGIRAAAFRLRTSRMGVAILFVAMTGCAGVSYTPTSSEQPRSPKNPASIEIVLANKPTRPYVIVGYIGTHAYESVAKSLAALRTESARVGLDGVSEVVCAPPGTVGQSNCAGNGFLWKGEDK